MANLKFYEGKNISLNKLIKAIESLSAQELIRAYYKFNKGLISPEEAENLKLNYIEELLSSYEPSAYKGLSSEGLIADILLYGEELLKGEGSIENNFNIREPK